MKIALVKDLSLQSIQDGFHALYPYLKLEFYAEKTQAGEVHLPANALAHNQTIGQLNSGFTSGEINFDGGVRVSEFEKTFHEMTGLDVQVYRKSGRIWMQTTKTDDWTLMEQNAKSEDEHRAIEPDEPMDYREMD
jgi:hypothetical protein